MGWPGLPDNVNPSLYLLWLVRNGRVRDWETLAREFGIDPWSQDTSSVIIRNYLEALHSADLISVEYKHKWHHHMRVPSEIKLSEKWFMLQLALGLSLTELTKLNESAIIASPYFGRPGRTVNAADVLVLMPFDPDFRPVYEDHIVGCARELQLNVARGDDFFTTHSVMSDLWSAIMSARVVIADCTGRNPNVFYEIGLAHAVGKPVILITQSNEDVPFDIRHLRYIQYDYTPRGMREFEKKLLDTLRTEIGRNSFESTPS